LADGDAVSFLIRHASGGFEEGVGVTAYYVVYTAYLRNESLVVDVGIGVLPAEV
jgi:hypothetical protein